ncbi:MAG: DUF423 domain-containing protein [Flavobacteriales bacterium]|nr:DUF423 domain-containing protein [Flavobacteriales bacterium]
MNYYKISFLLLTVAVICGAFGAHTLRDVLTPQKLDAWKTAVFYHFIHALGVLIVSGLMEIKILTTRSRYALHFLFAGIILFSGSLYLLSTKELLGISGMGWLGPITPIGGACFIAGWIICCFSMMKKQ